MNESDAAPPEPPLELDRLAHKVIGAAIEVHRHLGPGLLESLYESALCLELARCEIEFERQVPVRITYRGEWIGDGRIDLLVARQLVVETKAVEMLAGIHAAQTRTYLRAGGFRLGLLINFNERVLRDGIKRIINSE